MDRGARTAPGRQEAALLSRAAFGLLLFGLALPAAADELLPGEFRVKFPRELIGYQQGDKALTPSSFPTLTWLGKVLAEKQSRAVLFFKLHDDEHNHYAPSFAVGQRRMAFIRADINRRTSKVRLLELTGGKPQTVQPDQRDSYDYMFQWSPRYSWLGSGPLLQAFASQAGRKGEMNLYLARGTRQVRLTSGPEITKHPDFHPTEPKLLYEQKGRIHLLSFPRDLARLTAPPRSQRLSKGTQPEWAPDGKRFVYCREVGRAGGRTVHEISVRSMAFGREKRLFRGPSSAILRNPTWSPDGKHVAFYRGDQKAFGWDLYLVGADGAPARKVAEKVLIENYFDDVNPAWSPRGDRLFFFSTADQADGYYKIHWVDLQGRRGTVDYSDEFTTATDLATPRSADGLPELAFVAIERLSQGVYVVVLNHW